MIISDIEMKSALKKTKGQSVRLHVRISPKAYDILQQPNARQIIKEQVKQHKQNL